jgi:hypothetical protein
VSPPLVVQLLLRGNVCFGGVFILFYYFIFWLCASLMSRFILDIMLLQRLGVCGIILILINSLYRKKEL